MRHRSALIVLLCVSGPCVGMAPGRAELPSRDLLDRLRPAVLRVNAADCHDAGNAAAPSATGTGFLWGAANQVVTALHVVAGCTTVSVRSEELGRTVLGRVSRVSRPADLALLTLEAPLPLEPAMAAEAAPVANDDLLMLGYSLGAPTMGSNGVRLAYGASRLRDLLPPSIAEQLRALSSPSLDLDILRLDGILANGTSGAPIVDRRGRVVGVSDGGLEASGAAIAWAVPLRYVLSLPTSQDTLSSDAVRARPLHTAELDASPGGRVQCGELTFTKQRTRAFAQLAETADDPLGLQQLLAYYGQTPAGMGAFPYDIWVEAGSGAVVALPGGVRPASGPHCVAHDDYGVEIRFGGQRTGEANDVQRASSLFEQVVATAHADLVWPGDPTWTYATPHVQPSGKGSLVVRRKSFTGMDPRVGVQRGYAFETLMARGSTFVGVSVLLISAQSSMADTAAVQQCRFAPGASQCTAHLTRAKDWQTAVVGAALSTFPPQ